MSLDRRGGNLGMATLYVKIITPLDGMTLYQRKADNAVIPTDPNNIDYKELLILCDRDGMTNVIENP